MSDNNNLDKLKQEVRQLYDKSDIILPFHGWHHISFVYDMSIKFGQELKANLFLVSASALTHDLNYLVRIKSKVADGMELRRELLSKVGIDWNSISDIERIVNEASTTLRTEDISLEAKALSDADTLFKALPITPIIFASLYAREQNMELSKLASKIVEEQVTLYNKGIYFYSDSAKKYLSWAEVNIELWKNVKDYFCNEEFLHYFNEFTSHKR